MQRFALAMSGLVVERRTVGHAPSVRGRDEHTIEVQLPEGIRRRHKSGIAAWGLDQTRQPQLGVAKRSGFSVTTERMRGDTYVVCLAFPPPYILLARWKVNGRDLRPSSVFPTSCDSVLK